MLTLRDKIIGTLIAIFALGSISFIALANSQSFIDQKKEERTQYEQEQSELSAMNSAHRVKIAEHQKVIKEREKAIEDIENTIIKNKAEWERLGGKIELLTTQIDAEEELEGFTKEK